MGAPALAASVFLDKARPLLDFEPRIHWSLMQMQSGTTGINPLRIDSSAKQQGDLFEPISEEAPNERAAIRL